MSAIVGVWIVGGLCLVAGTAVLLAVVIIENNSI
jgi:hypothetical protein